MAADYHEAVTSSSWIFQGDWRMEKEPGLGLTMSGPSESLVAYWPVMMMFSGAYEDLWSRLAETQLVGEKQSDLWIQGWGVAWIGVQEMQDGQHPLTHYLKLNYYEV